MTDQEFAVLYAKTECDQGDAQVEFLPDDKRVEVLNGIQGTEKDSALKNFAGTFGKCKVLQTACSPSFLPAWFNPTDTIMYDESVPTDTPTKFEAALNEYKNLCTTATESASDYIESCNKDFDSKSFKEQFLGFFGNKEYDNECAMKSNIESSLVTGIANVSGQVNNLNFDLKTDSLNDMGKAVETLKSTLNTYSQNEPSEAQKDKLTKAQQDIGKAEAFLAAIKGAAAPEKFIKKDSILICTIGGVVHFVDDGQKEMEERRKEIIELLLASAKRSIDEYWKSGKVKNMASDEELAVRKCLMAELNLIDPGDPISKSQMEILGKIYPLVASTDKSGWQNPRLDELNMALKDYHISNSKSIEIFLAQASCESYFGGSAVEDVTGNRYIETYKNRGGNTTPGDEITYRGGGYVQMTFKDNYYTYADYLSGADKFKEIFGENYIPSGFKPEHAEAIKGNIDGVTGGAEYVAKYLPWDVSAYMWSCAPDYGNYLTDSVNTRIENGTDFRHAISQIGAGFHDYGEKNNIPNYRAGDNYDMKEATYIGIQGLFG